MIGKIVRREKLLGEVVSVHPDGFAHYVVEWQDGQITREYGPDLIKVDELKVKFSVRIPGKENPPDFGSGPGILVTQEIVYFKPKELPSFIDTIINDGNVLRDQFIEVVWEIQ